MSDPPVDQPPQPKRPVAKPAGLATYKRELRKQIHKRRLEPEITFLNITAMMDMMTIILVFLLKSLSSSPASLPQSSDLQLPKSILGSSTEGESEGLSVIISKSQIIVGDSVVCPVPPDASLNGVELKYKRGNRTDFYVVPLGDALSSWRETDKRIRLATGKDPSHSEAIIIGDQMMPYRLLTEVTYTLGQAGFAKFHLLVLQGGGKAT